MTRCHNSSVMNGIRGWSNRRAPSKLAASTRRATGHTVHVRTAICPPHMVCPPHMASEGTLTSRHAGRVFVLTVQCPLAPLDVHVAKLVQEEVVGLPTVDNISRSTVTTASRLLTDDATLPIRKDLYPKSTASAARAKRDKIQRSASDRWRRSCSPDSVRPRSCGHAGES